MSGGWASSDRRASLPVNWPKLRAQVRKRARETDPLHNPGGRCEWISPPTGRCVSVGTDCDHWENRADHRPEAMRWLCRRHHNIKTQQEAQAASAAKRARARREPERHPSTLRRRPTP